MLSVIIPVYNGEKYIERCLTSILESSLERLRVIVVDDGSIDETGDIVQKYSQADERVTYVRQKNSGVSTARNTGLKQVKTKYVTFVDADDWIDRDVYRIVCAVMEKDSIDIMQFLHCVTSCFQTKNQAFDGTYQIFTDRIFSHLFSEKHNLTPSVWDKVFRTEVIKGLEFPSQYKYGEDLTFLYGAVQRAKTIALTDYTGYYYFMNSESATQKRVIDGRKKLQDSMSTVELALYQNVVLSEYEKERIYLRLFEGVVAWNKALAVEFFRRNAYRKEMRLWLDALTVRYRNAFLEIKSMPQIYRYTLLHGTRFTILRAVLLTEMVGKKLGKRA